MLLLDLLRDLLIRASVMLTESTSTDLSARKLSRHALTAEVAVWDVGTAVAISQRMLTPWTTWRVPNGVDVLLPDIKSLELASTIPLGRDRRLGTHLLPKSFVDLGIVYVLRCNVQGLRYVGIELELVRKPRHGSGLPDAALRVE